MTDHGHDPSDGTDFFWLQIDRLILEGRTIQALQKLRDEFGGGIHDALEPLNHRFLRLREDPPEEYTNSEDDLKER